MTAHSILSYNIRYDLNESGPRNWANRQEAVVAEVQRYNPDLVAFQEVWRGQLLDLKESLPEYEWVVPVEGEEHTAIAYNPDEYTPLVENAEWLSESNTDSGVPGWDGSFQKRFTYAQFATADDNAFWLFNIHIYHTGEDAPTEGMELVRQRLTDVSSDGPAVVVGDLNAEPGEAVYETGRQSREPFRDLVSASERAETVAGPETTYIGFPDDDEKPCNIDHALVTPDVTVERVETIVPERETEEFCPSDHRPLLVGVSL
jgi:endonuclease/exonuclease/phosphatase family metal-dependent hydrolase